jgi:hypothetical protein
MLDEVFDEANAPSSLVVVPPGLYAHGVGDGIGIAIVFVMIGRD